MKITAFWGLLLLLGAGNACAQDKDKDKKPPVFNYTIDDPMDVFGRTPEVPEVHRYLFPDFYSRVPISKKDTTYTYECYDKRDSIMNVDTVTDINKVRFISVFKSYKDKDPGHMYVDAKGQKQQLPVSSIISRYDKVGNDRWMNINYSNNKYLELKEHRKDITRTDSATVQGADGKMVKKIYQYYKVVPAKER